MRLSLKRCVQILFLSLMCASSLKALPFEETKSLPIAFQGRIRSLEPAARLWLYETYHLHQLKPAHIPLFTMQTSSALELFWKTHFLGHAFLDQAPLFWIHYADVKTLLGLDAHQSHFSYQALKSALFETKDSSFSVMRTLLSYEFAKNRSEGNRQELKHLAPGLWVHLRHGTLFVAAKPQIAPWNQLSVGAPLTEDLVDLAQIEAQNKHIAQELLQLLHHVRTYETLVPAHHLNGPSSSAFLNMLPSKQLPGDWLPLQMLGENSDRTDTEPQDGKDNFTSFSNETFAQLQKNYHALQASALRYYAASLNQANTEEKDTLEIALTDAVHHFSSTLAQGYTSLAGEPYRQAAGKQLYYPTQWRLQAETAYYRLPLIEISVFAYCLACLLFLVGKSKLFNYLAISSLALGFLIHTTILVLRCYVLQRPPVSNMFETVVYVPWVTMLLGFGFFMKWRHRLILLASTLASIGLLILLKLTNVDARLENVQAVLDSQYWLIIHVLMIVASYGAFIMSGILGHFYLVLRLKEKQQTSSTQLLIKCLLQAMYVGVALLIPGTILGGVWAAESWGRFWDWDPKESWAFISACVYVFIIHAYTFGNIRDYGLAVGSIIGLMAISFTWYGVNYILGTGLHSYGFGQGGAIYYYAYLIAEALFLLQSTKILKQRKERNTLEKILPENL